MGTRSQAMQLDVAVCLHAGFCSGTSCQELSAETPQSRLVPARRECSARDAPTLNIKGNFHRRIRASTCGTGHFLLDQENAEYQLRVTDPTRLELLDSIGNDVASPFVSSMGILR